MCQLFIFIHLEKPAAEGGQVEGTPTGDTNQQVRASRCDILLQQIQVNKYFNRGRNCREPKINMPV